MKNTKHFFKRGISLALALVMCLSLLPTTAFAADEHDHDVVELVETEPVDEADAEPVAQSPLEAVIETVAAMGGVSMLADSIICDHCGGNAPWQGYGSQLGDGKSCYKCEACDSYTSGGQFIFSWRIKHTYTEKQSTNATCTRPGTAIYKCKWCDETERRNEAALGHNWDTTKWESNETYHWRVCKNSGCTEKGSMTEHTEDNGTVTKAATCAAKGTKTYKCTECGVVMRTEDITVVTDRHTGTVSAWTVSEDGTQHVQTCGDCGEVVKSHNAPAGVCTGNFTCGQDGCDLVVAGNANNHAVGCEPDWVAENGMHVKRYSLCNAVDIQHEAPARGCVGTDCECGLTVPGTGHSYGENWVTEKDATTHWHVCVNNCGVKGSEAPHVYENYTWNAEKKVYVGTCVCGATDEQTVIEHTCQWEADHDATYHWEKCTFNGCTETRNKVKHTYTGGNCQTKAVCKCGAEGALKSSTHATPDEETYEDVGNGTQHYVKYACCGVRKGNKIAGYTVEGHEYDKTTHVCKKCGAGCKHPENKIEYVTPSDANWSEDNCQWSCNACGATGSNPHDKGDYWFSATGTVCKDVTFTQWHDCAICGQRLHREAVGTREHTPGTPVKKNEKAATCTEAGSYNEVVYCSVCETEISREAKTIEAKGHTWGKYKSLKWEDDRGPGHVQVCDKCDAESEVSDHNYDTVVGTHDATCTGPATVTKQCVCGELSNTQTGPALGHNFQDVEVITEPTCTEAGQMKQGCSRCEETKVVEIEVKGHDFSEDWTNDGTYHWYDCSRCDYKDALAEHDYTWTWDAETGIFTGVCGTCGNIAQITDVPEHEHAAVEAWSSDGVNHWHACSFDGCPMQLEMVAHDEETVPGYAASCEAEGLTDGVKCPICERTTTEQEPIPAAGHTYGAWFNRVTPTETTEGEDIRLCVVCAHADYRVVEALGTGEGPEIEIDENDTPLAGLPFDLDPQEELTRGHLIYVLYWFEGEPEAAACTFTDVSDEAYYYEALGWAEENGIAVAYPDGTFKPDETVTRGDMETFLNLYNQYLGVDEEIYLGSDRDHKMLWGEAEIILNDFFSITLEV